MKPVNRVQEWFEKMKNTGETAKRKEKSPATVERAALLRDHLDWELNYADISPEKLVLDLNMTNQPPKDEKEFIDQNTVDRWLAGEVGNPQKRHLNALAAYFRYRNPDSIITPGHIKRRMDQMATEATMRTGQRGPVVPMPAGFGTMQAAVDQAIESTPEQTQQAFNSVLHGPLAPYASMFAHWLAIKQAMLQSNTVL